MIIDPAALTETAEVVVMVPAAGLVWGVGHRRYAQTVYHIWSPLQKLTSRASAGSTAAHNAMSCDMTSANY